MSISGLFDIMFDVLAGSPHYMVTGSLSFLPLTQGHREPGEDLDVFIRRDVFEAKRNAFKCAGAMQVLRVPEVAVAGTSAVSRVFAPRTGFVHLETAEGLLDIVQYEEDGMSLGLIVGLGIRFSMTRALSMRRSQLQWSGQRYDAAPPEFMFLTKAVGYLTAMQAGTAGEYQHSKHYADLVKMAPVIDWGFALRLLRSLRVQWRRTPLPGWIQRHFNPYGIVDIGTLKQLLM